MGFEFQIDMNVDVVMLFLNKKNLSSFEYCDLR